nr:DUF1772 domain-containing protein [Chryseolinea sp. H1M3-3]
MSVNLGLAKLSDAEYLRSMQSINRAILNPWFFMSFMGSLIMLPLSTWMSSRAGGYDLSFYLLLAATMLYVAGVFGVTIFGNVPLNEALDKWDMSTATLQELNNKRKEFEIPWNKYNMIRTLTNAVALAVLIWSIVRKY